MNAHALSLDDTGPSQSSAADFPRRKLVPVLTIVPNSPIIRMSPSHDSEVLVNWIVAAAGGDQQAFRSLYAATSAKLLGVILRLLNDRGESDELLQDVYVKIWRNAASFDAARGRPMTWLISIARYRAIDRLRSRRPTIDLDQVPETADPSPTADALLEMSDDARRLQAALAILAPRHAAIIRSAYFDGLTYQQLAAREGVAEGTLKSWVRRSLVRLRAELRDQTA